MFVCIKALLRNLILPPAGLILLGFLGLVLSRRYRTPGLTLVWMSLGSIWLCSLPLVSGALQRLAEPYPALDLSRPVSAQAVVILGAGSVRFAPEYGGMAAASDALERLNYGAFVARRTALPVLVTGAAEEAEGMRVTLLRDFDITARWVENKSGDTFENARNSARLLHADHVNRIILVTTATHEWRSVQEFTGAGLQVTPAPVGNLIDRELQFADFVPSPNALLHSHEAVYELVGERVRELFAALHLRRQQPQGVKRGLRIIN
jgi:uncharacterized SAM-binding protein YcdF (DUF218 family)